MLFILEQNSYYDISYVYICIWSNPHDDCDMGYNRGIPALRRSPVRHDSSPTPRLTRRWKPKRPMTNAKGQWVQGLINHAYINLISDSGVYR